MQTSGISRTTLALTFTVKTGQGVFQQSVVVLLDGRSQTAIEVYFNDIT